MCDICSDVAELLRTYKWEKEQAEELCPLFRPEITTLCIFIQTWFERQCHCLFKGPKSCDKFNDAIQGLALSIAEILKRISKDVKTLNLNPSQNSGSLEKEEEDHSDADKMDVSGTSEGKPGSADPMEDKEKETVDESAKSKQDSHNEELKRDFLENWSSWDIEEKEKILISFSKVFQQNFPLYRAFRHMVDFKFEDEDIPVYLLRNVCFFCERGGLDLIMSCFEEAKPETLPLTLAHAMTAIIINLKFWMSMDSIKQHVVPLRSSIIRYLCQFKEAHFKNTVNCCMFERMWTALKHPLDKYATFDKEGLDLAFVYFSSRTGIMRLTSILQINCHIDMYNEPCDSENLVERERIKSALANWLIENKIIEGIFGADLHVDLIEPSYVTLKFLAMQRRITSDHIDAMWSAAQPKDCRRQVLDLLQRLVENLEVALVLHLFRLCNMESEEETEQTLASILKRRILSSSNTGINTPVSEIDGSQASGHQRSSVEGREHTGDSPSSSPCDVETHKHLAKHSCNPDDVLPEKSAENVNNSDPSP